MAATYLSEGDACLDSGRASHFASSCLQVKRANDSPGQQLLLGAPIVELRCKDNSNAFALKGQKVTTGLANGTQHLSQELDTRRGMILHLNDFGKARDLDIQHHTVRRGIQVWQSNR